MSERILIIGAGAVGCTVGAALGDAGHTPAFAVRSRFPYLERRFGGAVVHYETAQFTDPDQLGDYDFVLICTKSYHTDGALKWVRRPLPETTTVAVLQNGVDHVERLSPYLPSAQLLPAIVQMACERVSPGVAVQPRQGRICVPDTARGKRFVALFSDTNAVVARADPNFVSVQWQKLGLNAVNGAICALTLQPNSVLANPEVNKLAQRLMAEVVAVGRAQGAEFPSDYIDTTLGILTGHAAEHWTSMAADRRDGQAMEWEIRNAVVGRLGRRHNIPTPLNDLVTTLLSVAR